MKPVEVEARAGSETETDPRLKRIGTQKRSGVKFLASSTKFGGKPNLTDLAKRETFCAKKSNAADLVFGF